MQGLRGDFQSLRVTSEEQSFVEQMEAEIFAEAFFEKQSSEVILQKRCFLVNFARFIRTLFHTTPPVSASGSNK